MSSFHVRSAESSVVRILPPTVSAISWGGTTDHVGVVTGCSVVASSIQTQWSLPFETPATAAAEEIARLRDRIIDAAGLSKQDIARGMGVDRRSLSGFVAGEIRPSAVRIRALGVLAESAEWAAARHGIRAKDIHRENSGEGAPLDLIALGRSSVIDQMERAAEALGLVRRGAVITRTRTLKREALYVKAREAWSDRLDKPTAGGQVRDPATYEQDLSNVARIQVAVTPEPRRKRI